MMLHHMDTELTKNNSPFIKEKVQKLVTKKTLKR